MSESSENKTNCSSGCHRVQVPSDEELEALNAMRKIKNKVRELRQAFSSLSSSEREETDRLRHLEPEMERLKEEWKKWEERRKEAARRRMILLGHEKPD